jgi:transcription elongation factor Elf1
MTKIKRLFWDIETSPNVVLSWRVGYDIKIDNDNILTERAIICIGYKWEGEKASHVLRWDENQCDKAMLKQFLAIANKADEMVAHNGDKFDLTWFKTRCIFHGLPTLPEYKTVDTLQWARKKFLFNSNKLDYIAKYLGLGGKIKTEFGLWKDVVLKKDAKALRRMLDYCKRDVELLEKVWDRLRQHTKHKTHAGVVAGRDKWTCPHDGSENIRVARGPRITAGGSKSYQMQCKDCGLSYSISATAHKAYQEWRKEQEEKAA